MSEDDDHPPRVAAVAVKLPPFWPSDPNIWFAQVEAQFATRGITNQRTMFEYVVASLSPDIATEIRDLILSPPAENQYTNLKEKLIQRTAASQQQRIQQLLNAEELGDKKPTQFLRRLQQLAGDTVRNEGVIIRELFLQRLPANVRMVLASTRDNTPIEELAQLADKVMEVAIPTVSKVAVKPSPPDFEMLQGEIAGLRQEIKRLQQAAHNQVPRRRSPSPHRYSSSPGTDHASTLCWYHQKFGTLAKKCRSPCSYSGNDQASH